MKILGKVGEVGLDELAIAGVTKYFEEKALSGIIGNGTLISGAVKLAVGMFMPKENKYIKAVGLGFGIDGVEDILTALLGATGTSSVFGGTANAVGW